MSTTSPSNLQSFRKKFSSGNSFVVYEDSLGVFFTEKITDHIILTGWVDHLMSFSSTISKTNSFS